MCTILKNKISITMCDVFKGGGGGGGGSPKIRTYDVSRGQNRYARLPLSVHCNMCKI